MPEHKIIQIVASESTPEKEAAFSKWYTEIHLPMLFGFEGVKRASRYQRKGEDNSAAKFLAIYEFDTQEDLEAFPFSQAFQDAIDDFEANKESLGFTMRWVGVYDQLTVLDR